MSNFLKCRIQKSSVLEGYVDEVLKFPHHGLEEYNLKVFSAFRNLNGVAYKMSVATDVEVYATECDVILLIDETFENESPEDVKALIFHCLLKIYPYYTGKGYPSIRIMKEVIGIDDRVLSVFGRAGIYENQIISATSNDAKAPKKVSIHRTAKTFPRFKK